MLKLQKFKGGEPLAVAMTAVRMGDRLLVIGCADTTIISQIAVKPGITGRACAVDDAAERTSRAAAAGERAGALVEVETASFAALPYDADAFDVVVVNHLLPRLRDGDRAACVSEAARVLRGGGRCVVVQGGRRGGVAGLFRGSPAMQGSEVEAVLSSAGFRAVRVIAEREGLLFVEGAKRAG